MADEEELRKEIAKEQEEAAEAEEDAAKKEEEAAEDEEDSEKKSRGKKFLKGAGKGAGKVAGKVWGGAKKHKHKVIKITLSIILIIGMLFSAYWFFTSTGLGQETTSEILNLPGTKTLNAIGKTQWEYFWDCQIMSTAGCEIAEAKGDTGGVFITKFDADSEEYEESNKAEGMGEPIHIEGVISGKTWTGGKRGEGPDIRDLKAEVDAEWDDEALAEEYPEGWTCTPDEVYVRDYFLCAHDPVDLEVWKGERESVCGAYMGSIDEDMSAALSCPVKASAEYGFTTTGYRKLRFSESPSPDDSIDESSKDIMWTADAPVKVTIGRGLKKKKPLRVYYEYPRKVNIIFSNNVPSDISDIYEGLKTEDMSAVLHDFEIVVDAVEGLEVECEDCDCSQKEKSIICQTDALGGKKIIGGGPDEGEYSYPMYLQFDEAKFDPGVFTDIGITANINYTTVMHRTEIVKIRYRGTGEGEGEPVETI